jgi:hypothetical protein
MHHGRPRLVVLLLRTRFSVASGGLTRGGGVVRPAWELDDKGGAHGY